MRICITGIAGFFASHLANRFLERGYEVAGIDLVPREEAWRVKGMDLEYHWRPLGDGLEGIKKVDWLIHAAAVTHPPFATQGHRYTIQVNVSDTVSLMDAARDWAGRVLHVSTFSVYGRNPYPSLPILESTPLSPSTFYGWSKAAQEMAVLSYVRRGELRATVLRMALMYGERERPGAVVSLFLRKALQGETISLDGGGWQVREMNYVGNAVEAVELVMGGIGEEGGAATDGAVYNIRGEPLSIRELAEQAIAFAGKGGYQVVPARAGEEGEVVMDGKRAELDLGYVPRIPFKVGFQRTGEWVRERIGRERIGEE